VLASHSLVRRGEHGKASTCMLSKLRYGHESTVSDHICSEWCPWYCLFTISCACQLYLVPVQLDTYVTTLVFFFRYSENGVSIVQVFSSARLQLAQAAGDLAGGRWAV